MKLEQEKDLPQPVRTNIDLVRHVENTLGFVLDDRKPPWKARQIEAGKLKRKRATDPGLFSVENLLLTIEWLRQEKRQVKSPAAVCWFVEDALKNAHSEPEPDELERQIQAAISKELNRGDQGWVGRLTRVQGYNARLEVYREWEGQRG